MSPADKQIRWYWIGYRWALVCAGLVGLSALGVWIDVSTISSGGSLDIGTGTLLPTAAVALLFVLALFTDRSLTLMGRVGGVVAVWLLWTVTSLLSLFVVGEVGLAIGWLPVAQEYFPLVSDVAWQLALAPFAILAMRRSTFFVTLPDKPAGGTPLDLATEQQHVAEEPINSEAATAYWHHASDEQLSVAAAHIAEYNGAGQRIIREESHQRRLHVSVIRDLAHGSALEAVTRGVRIERAFAGVTTVTLFFGTVFYAVIVKREESANPAEVFLRPVGRSGPGSYRS